VLGLGRESPSFSNLISVFKKASPSEILTLSAELSGLLPQKVEYPLIESFLGRNLEFLLEILVCIRMNLARLP
jgi:hypothetical protein